MSGTELERAAGRLVDEPTLIAPRLDRIADRVEQRRRRRRGVFGGGVAVVVLVAVGALVLQSDDPAPVVATGQLNTADVTSDSSAEAPAQTEVQEAPERDPGTWVEKWWSDRRWSGDGDGGSVFGGEIDLSVRHEPFDQAVADELAAAADETLVLDELTAYVVRGDGRVQIGVVSATAIVHIDAPEALVPDEDQLAELVEKFGSLDGVGFLFDGALPKLDDEWSGFGFELPPIDASPEELERWIDERMEKWAGEHPLFEGFERFDFELPPSDATPDELEEWIDERLRAFEHLDKDGWLGRGEFKLRWGPDHQHEPDHYIDSTSI